MLKAIFGGLNLSVLTGIFYLNIFCLNIVLSPAAFANINPIKSSACTASGHAVPKDHEAQIRSKLVQAGMNQPIECIRHAPFANLYEIKLGNSVIPMYVNAQVSHVLQSSISTNPSPITPISIATQKAGTPIRPEHKTALLANMTKLDLVTKDTPFFYTAIDGLLWGFAGGMPFLTTFDGKYLLESEISTISDGRFSWSDPNFDRQKNKHILDALDHSQLLLYKADHQKSVLYVATDINCPYCRALHRRIDELNRHGISVKIIAYPVYQESLEPMRRIWCQSDPKVRERLFDEAMIGKPINIACQNSDNLMQHNRLLAEGFGLDATPALYREDGTLFDGDLQSDQLLAFLGV